MKFFESVRPQFYFHGARIRKEKKTGQRIWRIDMVITLSVDEVLHCDEVVQRNYEHILTLDYRNNELGIEVMVPEQVLDFFALKDSPKPLLHLVRCDLTNLRMTRVEEIAELWVQMEVESTGSICDFVKDHVFTRLWVEFRPVQPELGAGFLAAADRLAASVRAGEVSQLTISGAGETVVIDKEAAERIHETAKAARRKKH